MRVLSRILAAGLMTAILIAGTGGSARADKICVKVDYEPVYEYRCFSFPQDSVPLVRGPFLP